MTFTYAPGQSGQHADKISKGFSGILQADGYAGYNLLLKRPTQDVILAYCWAHARRKLHDVTQSGAAPVAQEGLAQSQALYRIEKGLRGLTAGRIEVDNNPVERTIRPIALNRKSALFAGHDAGAQNWAVIASLTETRKINGIEPHSYLTDVLTAIAGGHKQTDINEVLPSKYAKHV